MPCIDARGHLRSPAPREVQSDRRAPSPPEMRSSYMDTTGLTIAGARRCHHPRAPLSCDTECEAARRRTSGGKRRNVRYRPPRSLANQQARVQDQARQTTERVLATANTVAAPGHHLFLVVDGNANIPN